MPQPTAYQVGEQIVRLVEEELPSEVYDKAPDFFTSVVEKTKDILKTMDQFGGEATPAQEQALNNMLAGVQKWFHDGD